MLQNYSMQSETSSKFNEESRAKIDTLITAFDHLGWDNQKDLNQEEILYFLNGRTKDGQFDQTLAQKIFTVLDVDDSNHITVEEFIKGYLQFEADLKKNNEDFNKKYQQEQNNFNDFDEQCRIYKSEKLNSEGFCENAKITVEITDVDIKKSLEGIDSIIIRVVYNDEIKEFNINGNNALINKKFEFKPKSRRDHFEFIMKGINDHNKEFDIGNKVFPLDEVTSQEEYTVQITIPEIEDENQVAAFINAKIILYWSDFEFYESKKKKSEQKLKKYKDALNKTNQYLNKIKEIYGDAGSSQNNFNIEFNNPSLGGGEYPDSRFKVPTLAKKTNDYNYEGNSNRQDFLVDDNPNSPSTFMGGNAGGNVYGNGGSMGLIKLLGLGCFALGLVGSLKRPDFPNEFGGLLVFVGCFMASASDPNKAKNIFRSNFVMIIALAVYDFLWLINHITLINIDKYTGGHENFGMFLALITCIGNTVLKAFLSMLLYKQYTNANQVANSQNNFTYI